jgi:hypothetical protein
LANDSASPQSYKSGIDLEGYGANIDTGKPETYRALANINQLLQGVLENLDKLEAAEAMSPEFAQSRRMAVEELRSEINLTACIRLHTSECGHTHFFSSSASRWRRVSKNFRHSPIPRLPPSKTIGVKTRSVQTKTPTGKSNDRLSACTAQFGFIRTLQHPCNQSQEDRLQLPATPNNPRQRSKPKIRPRPVSLGPRRTRILRGHRGRA